MSSSAAMSVAVVHGAATVAIAMEVELVDRVVALNDQADVAGVEQRLARPAKERTGTATGTEPEREVKVAQAGGRKGEPARRDSSSGRCRDRTGDPRLVRPMRYRCANRPAPYCTRVLCQPGNRCNGFGHLLGTNAG